MARIGVGVAFVLVCLHMVSCLGDSASPPEELVKWDELHVLAANPVAESGSGFEPMCRSVDGDPWGLRFNVLFQGTHRKGDSLERDISLKPGDSVDFDPIELAGVTGDLFEFNIDCVESLPDDDLYACVSEVVGQEMPIQQVDYFNYHQEKDTRKAKVAVAVVLDMSGSMVGLVNSLSPYNEDSFDAVSGFLAGDSIYERATDPQGARFAALESFIETLNDDDALVVFHFNEHNIGIVCSEGESLDERKQLCLSTNRGLVVDADPTSGGVSALYSIRGEERGRTPLWSAVDEAYRYMQSDAVVQQYPGLRHIVVVGDGPDTCGPSSDLSQCTGQCLAYNTSFETVRESVESQQPEDRVPIHFVQMQAKGYLERDPRQQEMACLTNGHYMFVNTLDIPGDRFEDVLATTLIRIRNTFRGYWRFAVPFGDLRKDSSPERGKLYSVAGRGKVKVGADRKLVKMEDVFLFEVNDSDVNGVNNADRRVAFRKECDPASPSACGGELESGVCGQISEWCDEQTLTCRSAQDWQVAGVKSSCKPENVYIAVEVRSKVGGQTEVENELVKLTLAETRCCHGECMPPGPPAIPDNVVKPAGMAASCFWYEDDRGWVRTTPEGLDSPVWVFFGTLNAGTGCQLEDILPYLAYEGNLSEDDWAYCLQYQNCFQSPVKPDANR